MTENNISIHDASRAGFELAVGSANELVRNLTDKLESFTLTVTEHDVFLPPDEAEENMAELIAECRNLILYLFSLTARYKHNIEYLNEAIEDDGTYSIYIKPYLKVEE